LFGVSCTPFALYISPEIGATVSVIGEDGVLDIDTTISLEATWHAMEDLVSMGLVRSIGIR
jgi:diketogulonate reductase-like aldo/keto reductase